MQPHLDELRRVSKRLDEIEGAARRHSNSFFEVFMSLPVPAWVKGADGVMVLSNRAYESTYGIAPANYIGTDDEGHWQASEAAGFSKLDGQAAESNSLALGVESIFNKLSNQYEALFVAKWPVSWDADGNVSQVAGMVLMSLVQRLAAEAAADEL